MDSPDETDAQETQVMVGSSYDAQDGPMVHLIVGDVDVQLSPNEAFDIIKAMYQSITMAEVHAALCMPLSDEMVEQGEGLWETVRMVYDNYRDTQRIARDMGVDVIDVARKLAASVESEEGQ